MQLDRKCRTSLFLLQPFVLFPISLPACPPACLSSYTTLFAMHLQLARHP
jgi:hypothetical protein